jgi:spore maturation protein SpmA
MDKIGRTHVPVSDSQIGFVAVSTSYLSWLPTVVMTAAWTSVMSWQSVSHRPASA